MSPAENAGVSDQVLALVRLAHHESEWTLKRAAEALQIGSTSASTIISEVIKAFHELARESRFGLGCAVEALNRVISAPVVGAFSVNVCGARDDAPVAAIEWYRAMLHSVLAHVQQASIGWLTTEIRLHGRDGDVAPGESRLPVAGEGAQREGGLHIDFPGSAAMAVAKQAGTKDLAPALVRLKATIAAGAGVPTSAITSMHALKVVTALGDELAEQGLLKRGWRHLGEWVTWGQRGPAGAVMSVEDVIDCLLGSFMLVQVRDGDSVLVSWDTTPEMLAAAQMGEANVVLAHPLAA